MVLAQFLAKGLGYITCWRFWQKSRHWDRVELKNIFWNSFILEVFCRFAIFCIFTLNHYLKMKNLVFSNTRMRKADNFANNIFSWKYLSVSMSLSIYHWAVIREWFTFCCTTRKFQKCIILTSFFSISLSFWNFNWSVRNRFTIVPSGHRRL